MASNICIFGDSNANIAKGRSPLGNGSILPASQINGQDCASSSTVLGNLQRAISNGTAYDDGQNGTFIIAVGTNDGFNSARTQSNITSMANIAINQLHCQNVVIIPPNPELTYNGKNFGQALDQAACNAAADVVNTLTDSGVSVTVVDPNTLKASTGSGWRPYDPDHLTNLALQHIVSNATNPSALSPSGKNSPTPLTPSENQAAAGTGGTGAAAQQSATSNNGTTAIKGNNDGTASATGVSLAVGNATQPLTPEQAIKLNSEFFSSLGPGAFTPVPALASLQKKAQGQYSNRQFIGPLTIALSVERTTVTVDLLTKSHISNNKNVAKQNSVLGFKRPLNATNTTNSSITDVSFQTQQKLSQSIYNAGAAATVQNLNGRTPNLNAVVNGTTGLVGAFNTLAASPQITKALNSSGINPLGTLTQFAGLALQAGLPSSQDTTGTATAGASGLALGEKTLTDAFNLASSISSSNIPTSLTGISNLALDIKTIICNIIIPAFSSPDIGALLNSNFKAAGKKIKKFIEHEIQEIKDEVIEPIKAAYKKLQDFFKPDNIKKLLGEILPDINQEIQKIIDKYFRCTSGPGAKKNDLSGKNPTSPAPAAAKDTVVEPPASTITGEVESQYYEDHPDYPVTINPTAAPGSGTMYVVAAKSNVPGISINSNENDIIMSGFPVTGNNQPIAPGSGTVYAPVNVGPLPNLNVPSEATNLGIAPVAPGNNPPNITYVAPPSYGSAGPASAAQQYTLNTGLPGAKGPGATP